MTVWKARYDNKVEKCEAQDRETAAFYYILNHYSGKYIKTSKIGRSERYYPTELEAWQYIRDRATQRHDHAHDEMLRQFEIVTAAQSRIAEIKKA